MAESVITKLAKSKMLKIRAGIISSFPKITGVAFGDGAATSGGIRIPLETDTELQHELLRQKIDKYTLSDDELSVLYECTLADEVLGGEKINEAALYDEDGDLVAIRSFSDKNKDNDIAMGFNFTDSFD